MKTQAKKLNFKKSNITELNSNMLMTINGGSDVEAAGEITTVSRYTSHLCDKIG